jgi:hypothetical protein
MEAVRQRLQGLVDPRGSQGTLMRGRTIYKGGVPHAHRGGGRQFGRPKGSGDMNPLQSAARRRLARQAAVGRKANGRRTH